MRYVLVMGLVLGTAGTALAEDGPNDLLMHPGRDTMGAARLGSTEINNPPHESFGMMQKPSNPDQAEIRVGPTGKPAVSGAQAKANAAAVHETRAAVAAGVMPTPAQAAAQAANAQAAGVAAAASSAATTKAESATEPTVIPEATPPEPQP